MNLGIGVCMGDVSFTNRPYSTSIGNTAQCVVENKSKGYSRKGPNNKKEGRVLSLKQQKEHLDPNRKVAYSQDSVPNRKLKNKNESTDNRKIYVKPPRHIQDKRKPENEYTSTPSRANLRRHIGKASSQAPKEIRNNHIHDFDRKTELQSGKTNDVIRNDDSLSKSKWQLVAERLKLNREIVSSTEDTLHEKEKTNSLNSLKNTTSYKLNTSHQPTPEYLYHDRATEVKTNPEPIPATLFDPSIFYITASKFCPCDHHDQLRKIQEHKIAIARTARRKAERAKRKELRRKRKAASLSLSRSSSDITTYAGKREVTVDILPSIPSLTCPTDNRDKNERIGNCCQKSFDDHDKDCKSAQNNLEDEKYPERISNSTESCTNNSKPLPSGSLECKVPNASKIEANDFEPVILDGCDSYSIQKNVKQVATGVECDITTQNKHRKLSREGGNWTLKPLASNKCDKISEDDPLDEHHHSRLENYGHQNSKKSHSSFNEYSSSSRNDFQALAIRPTPKTIEDYNEANKTITDFKHDPSEEVLSVKTSKPSKLPEKSASKYATNVVENAYFCDMKNRPFKDLHQETLSSPRAWIQNTSVRHSTDPNSFYPGSFHYKTLEFTYPPRRMSDFANFRGYRQQLLPNMKPTFDRSQLMSQHERSNHLLKHYNGTPSKRRNSDSYPSSTELEYGTQRIRRLSDSLATTQYPYPFTSEKLSDHQIPPHYLQQIQYVNQLQQMFESQRGKRQISPTVSLSISNSSLSDVSSDTSSLKNSEDEEKDNIGSNAVNKHRPLSMELSHNTYKHGTRLLRQSVLDSHPFLEPQLPQCIQNIILQHHWHSTREPHLPEAREKHLKKLSKHILLPDDPEDPAAFTLTPELTRPPRKPWCSSKPIPKIVGTFAFLMTCGIVAAILYVNQLSNIFRPMK